MMAVKIEKTLSEAEKEALYAFAFDAYTCENYSEGIRLFKYLTATSSLTSKYWKGLASCLQLTSQFQEALNCWSMVVLLEETDPMPHFHAAQCFIALNNQEDAMKAINLAAEMAPFDNDLQNNLKQLKARL